MAMPQTYESQIASVLQRLHLATISAAVRTKGQLVNGLERLKFQSNLKKGGRWTFQTAWLVDTLKHDAMNGLDITLIVNDEDVSTVKERQFKITQAGTYARNALFSAASPLQCARNFSTQVEPFAVLCADVASQLEFLVNRHTQTDEDSVILLYRTKPEQSQGQLPGNAKV